MSESEERNKRLMAEAEQIETESREVAEEAWAEVDPRAVQLASDIRSVVEEVRRLREALTEALEHLEKGYSETAGDPESGMAPEPADAWSYEAASIITYGRVALAGKASE